MRITLLQKCESTQKILKKIGHTDYWNIVWALEQTQGLGTSGNEWLSPLGGLYFSVSVPGIFEVMDLPIISFLPSLAICESLFELTGITPTIKWANDVLIKDRKVAGILIDVSSIKNKIDSLIIGIGINCNTRIMKYPNAVAISEVIKSEVSVFTLFAKVIEKLMINFRKMELGNRYEIVRQLRDLLDLENRWCTIETHKEKITGIVTEIEDDLTIKVMTDVGQRRIKPYLIMRISRR